MWFSLGLGLLYDRLIWDQISDTPSPVFKAMDQIWREKFKTNSKIDQRLVNPNTENDEKFGLIRLQSYDHAKAYAFLAELCLNIGSGKFDTYVKSYLSRPIGSKIDYEEFLSTFSKVDLAVVRYLETKHIVR